MKNAEVKEVLLTIRIGASRTEKEAIDAAIKWYKHSKRWKKKYKSLVRLSGRDII